MALGAGVGGVGWGGRLSKALVSSGGGGAEALGRTRNLVAWVVSCGLGRT